MNNKVALVLDPDFGERVIQLAERMPVWIIDSPKNCSVIEKARSVESFGAGGERITTFKAKERELYAAVCERIVQSLDDHYNENSQSLGYSELEVTGVSLSEVSLRPFLELKFDQFLVTSTGFIANKSKL